jgi:RHS repeat-associated protein
LYRLTGETIAADPNGANGAATYTLDPMGNRLSLTSTLSAVPSTTSTYDANDRQNGSTYDQNGSPLSSGANTYAYDFENRLKQAGTVSIAYDGDGNRVLMTAGGTATAYLVDSLNPTGYPQVLEELVGGAVQRVYTYGTSRISQSQYLNNTWTTSFYGYDGQGSVRFLTDGTGAVTDRYTYDAFGNQLAASGTTPNLYRYVGEPFDQALQLIYLRTRYMNPASGRFWTMDSAQGDPFDPPSLHKYLYADGDPLNRFDPLGLFTMGQGRTVHIWIGLDFMADGLVKGIFGRRSGTGRGAVSLGKILFGRAPSLAVAFNGSGRFPDLVDINDHFMFEIKTRNDRAAGVKQLDEYLGLANLWDPFAKGLFGSQPYRWRPGTVADFSPFPVVFCDDYMTCLAFVDQPDPNGVITYTEMDLKPVLLTIAVVGVLGILAAAYLAPFIVGLTELVGTMGAAAAAWGTAAAAEITLGEPLFAH